MTLMWTLVALFLYSEVAVITLLLLPIISCTRWKVIIGSRPVQAMSQYFNYFFGFMAFALILLFADALREIYKYNGVNSEITLQATVGAVEHVHKLLFRAQRNSYISGFALFLWLVLRRMVRLVLTVATLEAESAAALRQAKGATQAAQAMLDAQSGEQDNESLEAEKKRVAELEAKLKSALSEIEKSEKNMAAMKKQAESTNREYDRLAEECQRLQTQLRREGSGDMKKDD